MYKGYQWLGHFSIRIAFLSGRKQQRRPRDVSHPTMCYGGAASRTSAKFNVSGPLGLARRGERIIMRVGEKGETARKLIGEGFRGYDPGIPTASHMLG